MLHVLYTHKGKINVSFSTNPFKRITKLFVPGDIKLPRNFLSKIVPKYHTRAVITSGLFIFYPIFEDHFFVFKEVFSENSVLMYGLYSRAACNQERLMMGRVR